MALIKGS